MWHKTTLSDPWRKLPPPLYENSLYGKFYHYGWCCVELVYPNFQYFCLIHHQLVAQTLKPTNCQHFYLPPFHHIYHLFYLIHHQVIAIVISFTFALMIHGHQVSVLYNTYIIQYNIQLMYDIYFDGAREIWTNQSTRVPSKCHLYKQKVSSTS